VNRGGEVDRRKLTNTFPNTRPSIEQTRKRGSCCWSICQDAVLRQDHHRDYSRQSLIFAGKEMECARTVLTLAISRDERSIGTMSVRDDATSAAATRRRRRQARVADEPRRRREAQELWTERHRQR
jgi:hypothetical protein